MWRLTVYSILIKAERLARKLIWQETLEVTELQNELIKMHVKDGIYYINNNIITIDKTIH